MSEKTPVEPHVAWVETGHCPEIHRSKAWCNGRRGHVGAHWAPSLLFGETQPSKARGVYWQARAPQQPMSEESGE